MAIIKNSMQKYIIIATRAKPEKQIFHNKSKTNSFR